MFSIGNPAHSQWQQSSELDSVHEPFEACQTFLVMVRGKTSKSAAPRQAEELVKHGLAVRSFRRPSATVLITDQGALPWTLDVDEGASSSWGVNGSKVWNIDYRTPHGAHELCLRTYLQVGAARACVHKAGSIPGRSIGSGGGYPETLEVLQAVPLT